MAQRRELGRIEAISDDDTGMYRMNEIDSLPNWVDDYVKSDFTFNEAMDYAGAIIERARKARRKYNEAKHHDAQAGV